MSARAVLLVAVAALVIVSCSVMLADAQQPGSSPSLSASNQGGDADNVCSRNTTLGKSIIAAMNLSYPGLGPVAAAAANQQYGLACELLAEYYVTAPSGSWLRIPPVTPGTSRAGGTADQALDDIFTLSGVQETAKIPRNKDGGLDWYDKGPRDDPEFMNCLNRHEVFATLLQAWQQTGNPIYAAKLGDLMYDWVLHLPCNPCTTGTMESPWRILEVGIRTVLPWPSAFYGLQASSSFNSSARVLTLLAMHEHAIALMKYGTEGAPNWRMQQWAGLTVTALAFPELAGSPQFLQQALAGMETEIKTEVYPDGVENEQTSSYDAMAANNFYQVLYTVEQAGRTAPTSYTLLVENMYNYLAYAVDQDGHPPRNGDADLVQPWANPSWQDIKKRFNRSDWEYVYSGGRSGTKPPGTPSIIFPWAGQFIMKSGYTLSDQWAFFDVGVYGSSIHAHRDKLHLNVRAYGSLLLVDSGRFAYQGTGAVYHSQYAITTRAHNTISIDNCDQSTAPAVATAPVDPTTYTITEEYDYARASMSLWDNLTGNATHTRAVYFQKGQWFIVVDRIATDRPRTIQATWHAHPNGTVAVNATNGVAIVTGVPRGQIAVIPAADLTSTSELQSPAWTNVTVVKGQQPPEYKYYQGWFSESYLDCEPSPTLVYDTAITSGKVFAWLLLPSPTVTGTANAAIDIIDRDATSVTVKVMVQGMPDVVQHIVLG